MSKPKSPFPHPTTWPVMHLRDLCLKIGSGATPTGGDSSYLKQRRTWALVRSQNIFDRHFDTGGLAFIDDDQAARLKGVELWPNDVLLNITGDGITFGRACRVAPQTLPAVVNQHVAIVRPDQTKLRSGFLLAYLTHPLVKPYIAGFNTGGSRRAVTKAHIESFEIPIPDLNCQDAISSVLDTIDHKIELNRRVSQTLETLAQTIFKAWFMDFEPVLERARGQAHASVQAKYGISVEAMATLPVSMSTNQGAPLPSGWTLRPLSEVTQYLNRGISPKYVDAGGTLVLNQKCIRNQQVSTKEGRRHDQAQRSIEGRQLQIGDILVNSTGVGTLGRVAQVMTLKEPTIVDSHVTMVRADAQKITANYLGMALCARQSDIEALGEGSMNRPGIRGGPLG